jgi:hypothetical protein
MSLTKMMFGTAYTLAEMGFTLEFLCILPFHIQEENVEEM